MSESGICFIYREDPASPKEFVEFWGRQYQYPDESLYTEGLARPLTIDRIRQLYAWKNGGKLSRNKQRSVERNYIERLQDLNGMPLDTSARSFLDLFPSGGAIWRIFWLHIWQPQRFPIYDQHVHRAMSFIQRRSPEDLRQFSDNEKIAAYLERYLPFQHQFEGLDRRAVDRALWAFGRFVRDWEFPGS